jgi:hypothetical protein
LAQGFQTGKSILCGSTCNAWLTLVNASTLETQSLSPSNGWEVFLKL